MESEHLTTELSDQDRVLLVFGYLGPLALFSLVASRREFVKWHAKQGLLLFLASFALYVVYRGLDLLAYSLWNLLGNFLRVGAWLTATGMLVLALLCIVRALEGERFKIPVLGDLTDRL